MALLRGQKTQQGLNASERQELIELESQLFGT